MNPFGDMTVTITRKQFRAMLHALNDIRVSAGLPSEDVDDDSFRWFADIMAPEKPSPNRIFYDGLPGMADQDDPLAQEFQWPSKVWGLGIRRLNRLALMSYSEFYPHTVGFSLVFASRAAMERFHGEQSLRNGLNALECADALEIERENMMDWAHPAARGLMLLEWSGDEIARVEK